MKQIMPGLLVLLLLSLTASPGYCANIPGASAFIIKPDINFGTVAEGNTVEHTFAVENRGDAPLSILRVKSG